VKDLDEKLLGFMEGSGVTTTDFSDPKVFGDQPVKLVYKDVWKLAPSGRMRSWRTRCHTRSSKSGWYIHGHLSPIDNH
jgi:hypothetical protein